LGVGSGQLRGVVAWFLSGYEIVLGLH
jgi:hypothetical protein